MTSGFIQLGMLNLDKGLHVHVGWDQVDGHDLLHVAHLAAVGLATFARRPVRSTGQGAGDEGSEQRCFEGLHSPPWEARPVFMRRWLGTKQYGRSHAPCSVRSYLVHLRAKQSPPGIGRLLNCRSRMYAALGQHC